MSRLNRGSCKHLSVCPVSLKNLVFCSFCDWSRCHDYAVESLLLKIKTQPVSGWACLIAADSDCIAVGLWDFLQIRRNICCWCFHCMLGEKNILLHIKTAQAVSVLVDIDSNINYTFHWWVSFVCGNSTTCFLFKFAVNPRFLTSRGSPYCMLCGRPHWGAEFKEFRNDLRITWKNSSE